MGSLVQVNWQVLVEGPAWRANLKLRILMVDLVDERLLVRAHQEILVELHAIKE